VGNIEKNGYLNLAKTSRHLSTDEAESKYKHFLCDKGDLVIASSGISFDNDGYLRTRGAFIENEHLPLCLNTSTIRFKALNDNNLVFLKHWLQSFEFRKQITMLVTGSAQQNFGPSHLKQIKIKLPPLAQQKRIAAILDKADEIKRKREQAIAKLDQLAQSIFVEMFGDIESNSKKLSKVTLKDVCLRVTDGTHQSPKWQSDGVPFLFISNIVNGEIVLKTNKYISNTTYDELTNRCRIEVGDVLYTTVGTYGNVAIVRTTEKFCFQRHIAHIKPDQNIVNSVFLSAMLFSNCVKRQADRIAKGIAQKTVNLGDICKFIIFCPPLALQEQFATRISKLEKLKASNIAALAKHNQLFASLQNQAFTGQL
jgi:type I restriction enzyme S subunit